MKRLNLKNHLYTLDKSQANAQLKSNQLADYVHDVNH